MGKPQRVGVLRRQLTRFVRDRDSSAWAVRCRDRDGRRGLLLIDVTDTGVSLAASAPGPWHIQPLDVGALRRALREAILHLASASTQQHQSASETAMSECIDSDGTVYDLASGVRIGVVDSERGTVLLDEDDSREG